MLFKLYLQDKKASVLGYDWLEVLAIVPFRHTLHEVCEDCREEGEAPFYYITQSWFYCRTEQGIVQLCENDLMHEVDIGIYCEQGGEAAAKNRREGWEKCQKAIASR
jgi:hypothetical protein